MCVSCPLPETYLSGTRPRVQAQKTFFDIRPNSTHVRPQRICLVPLLSSPVPTHAYLSIFHPSLSSISALVYHTNNWFGNIGPLQEVKVLKSLTHECIIEYIKYWMFSRFFSGGRYQIHFRTQKWNNCQKFWVLRPPCRFHFRNNFWVLKWSLRGFEATWKDSKTSRNLARFAQKTPWTSKIWGNGKWMYETPFSPFPKQTCQTTYRRCVRGTHHYVVSFENASGLLKFYWVLVWVDRRAFRAYKGVL